MKGVSTKTFLSRVLFLCYIPAICLICFADSSNIPSIQKTILGLPSDKVIHFLMFAPFPIMAYLSFDHDRKKSHSALFVLYAFLFGTFLAMMTEVIQSFIPSRSMELYDFYADVIALLVVSIFVLLVDFSHRP